MTKSSSQLESEVQEAIAGSGSPAAARRDYYPNDLLPGDLVVRRDVRGRKKFRVSHTRTSGQFTQVYTRQVGGSGQIITFDRSQLRTA